MLQGYDFAGSVGHFTQRERQLIDEVGALCAGLLLAAAEIKALAAPEGKSRPAGSAAEKLTAAKSKFLEDIAKIEAAENVLLAEALVKAFRAERIVLFAFFFIT